MVGGRFVEGIYIGDPAKISHFPAITINAKELNRKKYSTVQSEILTDRENSQRFPPYQEDVGKFRNGGRGEESSLKFVR